MANERGAGAKARKDDATTINNDKRNQTLKDGELVKTRKGRQQYVKPKRGPLGVKHVPYDKNRLSDSEMEDWGVNTEDPFYSDGGTVKKAKGGMCRGGRAATRGTKFSGVK